MKTPSALPTNPPSLGNLAPSGSQCQTIGDLLAWATSRLPEAQSSDVSRREARLLLSTILDLPEAHLFARPESTVGGESSRRFHRLWSRRLASEPTAYLLGRREFYGRTFAVDHRVLIPRPETEHLVDAALAELPQRARVHEIGTGSGAVAITLKLERPDLQVTASDLSPAALTVAARNAGQLKAGNIGLACVDLLAALRLAAIDAIVANLPYIALSDRQLLSRDIVDYEPRVALFGGQDGLDCFQQFFASLADSTPRPKHVLLEIGDGQNHAVTALATSAGYTLNNTVADLSGRIRIVEFTPN